MHIILFFSLTAVSYTVTWRILRLFTFPSPFCPSLSLCPFFFFSSFLFWHSRFFTGKTWNKLLDCRVWKQYWFLCLCFFIMSYPLRLKNETLLSLFYLIKTKNTHTQTQNHTNRKNFRFMGRFWHLNVKTLCLNVSILQSYCSCYEGGTTIASYSDFFSQLLNAWSDMGAPSTYVQWKKKRQGYPGIMQSPHPAMAKSFKKPISFILLCQWHRIPEDLHLPCVHVTGRGIMV